MKKFYIESLGCPKNLVDSEFLSGNLIKKHNYILVNSPEKADIIFINTCGFIKPAKEESIEYIFQYHKLNKKVVVTGCLVNRYKNELVEELKEIKREDILTLNEIFIKYTGVKFNDKRNLYNNRINLLNKSYRYIKISDGCSRECAFCTIPSIKGKIFSRKIDTIIEEIKKLLKENKINEFILVAQDLINFGIDNNETLLQLLENIENIQEDFKIRLLYLYPDKRLIDIASFMKSSKKLVHYLDIPFQHIDSTILKRMNRISDEEFYYDIINDLRKIIPDIVLRSTFIVGFPGEKEKNFYNLVEFLKDVKLNWVGFYKYYDEENTTSFTFSDKIVEEEKEERITYITSIQKEITSNWLSERVGKRYEIIIDEIIPEENMILARSDYEAPEIDGNIIIYTDKLDKIKYHNKLNIKIIKSFDYDMEGIIE